MVNGVLVDVENICDCFRVVCRFVTLYQQFPCFIVQHFYHLLCLLYTCCKGVTAFVKIAITPLNSPPRKEMSHEYIVKRLEKICNSLNQLRFRKILSDVYLEHITATIHSVFMPGYHGKFWRRKVPRLLVHCTPTASSIPTRFDSRQKHLPLSSAKVIRMSASRLLVIAFLCVSP